MTMGKTQKSNKEAKKPAAHTAKEKKAAKQAKKQAGASTPIAVR
jgi:hypothetical protein